jgi:hypothetical protein
VKNPPRPARRWAIALAIAVLGTLLAGTGSSLSAQTPEGTMITNTATATYTDANGNTYTAASGSVSVTVGFQGSLAVTSPAAASPNSPSTGNTATWTITNNGNGADQIQVAVTSSDTNVAGNITYEFNATAYPSLAALNTALLAASIPATTSITIDVIYEVQAGQGGNASNVELTATSQRPGGDSNSSITVVTAVLAGTVSVTSNTPTIDRLPSNGATLYTTTFQVGSGLTGSADIQLTASVVAPNGATVVFTGIREAGAPVFEVPPTTTIAFLAGESRTLEVQYRVDGVPADAGQNSTVTLTATGPAAAGSPTDADNHVVTIVAPSLLVVKTVHASEADAQGNTTSTLTGNPQPGTTIWYRVQVTNNGTATAILSGGANGISDDVSALPVAYLGGSLNQTGSPTAWDTLAEAGGVITGTIAAGLPGGGATAWFVFAVTIN